MSQKKQIECLTRLQTLSGTTEDIFGFLFDEKLINAEAVKAIRQSSDAAKMLQAYLLDLSKTDKLQLLEYNWQILPVERISITIVTNRATKEFTYNL